MFGSRLSRHEQDNRDDFRGLRKIVRRFSERLEAHAIEARAMREEANATIAERHAENQAGIAQVQTEVRQVAGKVKNMVWIATIAVGAVGVLFKDVALPALLHLFGIKP